jgi:preprotein translocase subunit SecG
MGTIFTLFMVLIMIACVLLVIIIMAQNPKGGGLSSTFGGTSSAQFGVQRTNDFMEKATWTLGITIVVICMLSVILTAKPKAAGTVPAQAPVQTEAPAQNAPATNSGTAPVQTPVQTPAPAGN